MLSNKESYGDEALFDPDVDYFGDRYRTRSNPNKQEEPLGGVCQRKGLWVFRLMNCWGLFGFIISFNPPSWTWQLELLVYTPRVNSTFCARWLASSEVISQVLAIHLRAVEEKLNDFCQYIVTNNVYLWSASYSACVVYTKTIIQWYVPSFAAW